MTSRKSVASTALLVTLLAGCGLLVDHRITARTAQALDTYPPIGRFVTVDGRRVHYVQRGSGPDLVLLHGASGTLREFTYEMMTQLEGRYRVTAFDRPGLGYTDPDPRLAGRFDARAESPAAQAALLAKAARAIGVSDPVVMGHSYGGAVAMAWALDHDPAAAVILSGATQPWPGGLGPLYTLTGSAIGGATLVPLISAFAPRRLVRDVVARVFAPQSPPVGYIDYVGVPLALRSASFRANAQQIKTLHDHLVEMSPRYTGLDLPVEIVHGTADEIVPLEVHSEPLAAQVPGATLTRLEGIGHMPHHMRRDDVIAAIDRAAARAGLR